MFLAISNVVEITKLTFKSSNFLQNLKVSEILEFKMLVKFNPYKQMRGRVNANRVKNDHLESNAYFEASLEKYLNYGTTTPTGAFRPKQPILDIIGLS